MREHAEYYKQFIDVHPGGGIRRNPKRKNAGSYSSPANFVPPSDAEIDRVFENHLTNMARGGTWGDNMEIVAFASSMGYNVKIYQRDFAYVISGNGDETTQPTAHIAYHMWEHYSSIRNLDGPHTGMPNVVERKLSPEEELKQQKKLAETPVVQPWQIDVVEKSLPFLADKPTIKRAIEAARGDINAAVSNLMDAEENGSTSSYVESSSVERDHDSDDEQHDAPNKRQDRRLSKATRKHRSNESRHALSHLAVQDVSQESFSSWNSEASSQPESSQQSNNTPDTSIDSRDASVKEEKAKDASKPTASTNAKPLPRLKLLPPKPPPGKTAQKQQGPPRISARDRKDIKKQAQKAARKERQQAASHSGGRTESPASVGIQLRAKGMTETPPVDTLRTLYI